jgi:hypothetical protein
MSNLKPCPFCNAQMRYLFIEYEDNSQVHHPNNTCMLSSTVWPVLEWQNRPTEDSLCAERDRESAVAIVYLKDRDAARAERDQALDAIEKLKSDVNLAELQLHQTRAEVERLARVIATICDPASWHVNSRGVMYWTGKTYATDIAREALINRDSAGEFRGPDGEWRRM